VVRRTFVVDVWCILGVSGGPTVVQSLNENLELEHLVLMGRKFTLDNRMGRALVGLMGLWYK
jgi:hypothetical protein